MRVANVSSTAKAADPRRANICALVRSCPETASWLCTDVRYGFKRASWLSVRCTPASSSRKPSPTYPRESIVRRAPCMASNGEVEGPDDHAGQAPRAHTVFRRPRRQLRHLTVKLRGRTTTPDKRRGRTLSPGARGAKQTTPHGPLQRLLDARSGSLCISKRSRRIGMALFERSLTFRVLLIKALQTCSAPLEIRTVNRKARS